MSTPESDQVLDIAYRSAGVGDILQDSDECPVPNGWHLMDGATLVSYEWPAFVTKMGISGGTFALPCPQRCVEAHHWIIKLGKRRAVPRATLPDDLEAAQKTAVRRR